jgi:hypothetical protein
LFVLVATGTEPFGSVAELVVFVCRHRAMWVEVRSREFAGPCRVWGVTVKIIACSQSRRRDCNVAVFCPIARVDGDWVPNKRSLPRFYVRSATESDICGGWAFIHSACGLSLSRTTSA